MMSLALSVAYAFKHPPVSLPMALYTIFRKNVNRLTAGLVHDVAASRMECVPATSVMAVRCRVPIGRLCSAFAAMSPSLVVEPDMGLHYISRPES